MDSRYKKRRDREDKWQEVNEEAFQKGFEFAIERLRENEFYGHYAQSLADWLERHLSQEVTSDKAKGK